MTVREAGEAEYEQNKQLLEQMIGSSKATHAAALDEELRRYGDVEPTCESAVETLVERHVLAHLPRACVDERGAGAAAGACRAAR